MIHSVYHEVGHAAAARRFGGAITQLEIEHDVNGEYFGSLNVTPPPGLQLVAEIAQWFAGPLAEVRSRGGSREIDISRSFIQLAVANQKLAIPVAMVGPGGNIVVQRGTFSNDWNQIWNLLNAPAAGVVPLELFLQALKATVELVNDAAFWNNVHTVAQAILPLPALAGLAAGTTANVTAEVNAAFAPLPP